MNGVVCDFVLHDDQPNAGADEVAHVPKFRVFVQIMKTDLFGVTIHGRAGTPAVAV